MHHARPAPPGHRQGLRLPGQDFAVLVPEGARVLQGEAVDASQQAGHALLYAHSAAGCLEQWGQTTPRAISPLTAGGMPPPNRAVMSVSTTARVNDNASEAGCAAAGAADA